jgi:hypothetical protein
VRTTPKKAQSYTQQYGASRSWAVRGSSDPAACEVVKPHFHTRTSLNDEANQIPGLSLFQLTNCCTLERKASFKSYGVRDRFNGSMRAAIDPPLQLTRRKPHRVCPWVAIDWSCMVTQFNQPFLGRMRGRSGVCPHFLLAPGISLHCQHVWYPITKTFLFSIFMQWSSRNHLELDK